MGYWIEGPNYTPPPPIAHDGLSTAQRAELKTHLQTFVGLDGHTWSADAIKEGLAYARDEWGLKLKRSDVDAICREIVEEWS